MALRKTLQTSNPNSASSFGFGNEVVTGTRFYVDSGNSSASDGNLGINPRQPLATLNGANNRATANNGDYVYLLPGHAETISADAATSPGPNMTVAGVTVIGMGVGSDRPTFTFDNTAADFKMNAANCKIHNVIFQAGVASQVMGIEVSGDDCEISYNEFRNTSAFEMLIAVNIGIASNDADRCYVHDNRFISDTAGSTSAVSFTAIQAGVRVEDNYIRGDYSDACIQSAVVHTDCVVKNNYLQNDNNTAHGIQFTDAATGIVQDNMIVTDAIATAADLGSCFADGNRFYDDGDATTDATGRTVPEAVTAGATMPGAISTAVSHAVGLTTDPKTLFTITGGTIHVLNIIGTVVTEIASGARTQQLQAIVTFPSATVNMSTAVETDGDARGTVYHFLGVTGILTPETSGVVLENNDEINSAANKPTSWIVPAGIIGVDSGAAGVGDVDWVMTYVANSGAVVVAA